MRPIIWQSPSIPISCCLRYACGCIADGDRDDSERTPSISFWSTTNRESFSTYEAILDGVNANLIKATTAEEALTSLLKTDIAVILMDVCMPDLDGFELAAMIRNHPRHEKTAVIFISAVRLETDDLLKGYRTGAVDYVSVPVVPEILRAKVQIFVELYRKTRQLDSLNAELEERVKQRTEQLEDSHSLLQQSEERLRLASEAARLATFEYDLIERQLQWSPNISEVLHTGVPERQRFDAFIELMHPDDRDAARIYFGDAHLADTTTEIEFRVKGTRGVAWILARARAFKNGEGAVPRVLGTLLDITDRKSTESHQQLLMAELDHRVKNILANVAAIARLSSSNAVSIKAFSSALDGRIHAMSAAHDLLRQSSWTGVDLHELVQGALEPYRSRTDNEIIGRGRAIAPDVEIRAVDGARLARACDECGEARRALRLRRQSCGELVPHPRKRRRQESNLHGKSAADLAALHLIETALASPSFAAPRPNAVGRLK